MSTIEDKIAEIITEVAPSLGKVDIAIRNYSRSTDIYDLNLFESVKRELIDLMVDLSHAHGQLKYYHVMYGEGRKTKKAEVFAKLKDGGMNATSADKLVYNEKEYREFMKTMGQVEEAFQKVNSKYYLIDNTLSALQQSIANARNVENK